MRLLTLLFFYLGAGYITAQSTTPTVRSLFSAQWYNDDLTGPARAEAVRKLQNDNWFTSDTMYTMSEKEPGKKIMEVVHYPVPPYLDENGHVVYLVAELAPQFPGGKKALETFKSDVLGLLAAGPDDEVQRSVYIRCVIDTDGSVTEVAEAQPHGEHVSREIIEKCLDGVRYMPAWSPAMFRGKAVRNAVLISFSLK